MKKMTQIATAVALATAVAMPAMAAEGSGSVTLTSDYLWRGQSQTSNGAALQAGYEWTAGAWSYGVWGSNVDFTGSNPAMEYDLYGSFSGGSDDAGYSIGYLYYGYTAGLASASEISVGGHYKMVSLDYYVNTANTSATYTDLNAEFEAGPGSLTVNYGSMTGYTTYGLTYSMTVGGYDVGLQYASYDFAGVLTGSNTALSIGKSF